MTIEQDLYAVLAAHGGLAALVSTRIYQVAFPVGATFPCVTFQIISEPTAQAVSGAIVGSHPRYQLTAWAEDRDVVANVGEQLKLAAVSGIGTFKDVTVQGGPATHEPDADLFRRDIDAILLVAA
jgi:hypothetical protein